MGKLKLEEPWISFGVQDRYTLLALEHRRGEAPLTMYADLDPVMCLRYNKVDHITKQHIVAFHFKSLNKIRSLKWVGQQLVDVPNKE